MKERKNVKHKLQKHLIRQRLTTLKTQNLTNRILLISNAMLHNVNLQSKDKADYRTTKVKPVGIHQVQLDRSYWYQFPSKCHVTLPL